MTEQDFYHLLQGAVAGSHRHLELLLELYMPLINKYSYIDNVLDEDLSVNVKSKCTISAV